MVCYATYIQYGDRADSFSESDSFKISELFHLSRIIFLVGEQVENRRLNAEYEGKAFFCSS